MYQFMSNSCSVLVTLLFVFSSAAGQTRTSSSHTKVGSFTLQDRAFGVFGTASHKSEDARYPDYVNYSARFALLVGAKTEKGEIFVSSGIGNEATYRSEWSPNFDSWSLDFQPSFATVEKVATLSYSDAVEFEGHSGLGLSVAQKVYQFNSAGHALIEFFITLDANATALNDVYLGFFADIDVPNADNSDTPADDKIGFAKNGQAPFIYDNVAKAENTPLLGAKILGTDKAIVVCWPVDDEPTDDAGWYARLRGDADQFNGDTPADTRFLLSYGPISLAPGESVTFPVAVAQAEDVAAFAGELVDAEKFYVDGLKGPALKKIMPVLEQFAAESNRLPERLQLHKNYPNPFNPETKIRFDIPRAQPVLLTIYNAAGQRVKNLVDRELAAGSYSVRWDGTNDSGDTLASGVYLAVLRAGEFVARIKLTYLK